METQFKDVAHLYLGCKMQDIFLQGDYEPSVLLGINTKGAAGNLEFLADGVWQMAAIFKPILRPLSSMTDAEFKEAVFLRWGISRDIIEQKVSEIKRLKEVQHPVKYGTSIPYVGLDKEGKHYISATLSQQSLTPSQTIFFLKNHFDLFGLIENGQAIDATTLNPNPYQP